MFAALGLLALSATPALTLLSVDPMVKVRPGATPSPVPPTVVAARGECEAVQLWVSPPASQVALAAGPLRKANGKASPIPVTLYREEFLDVREPSNTEGAPGLWPDPLIPVRDAYAKQERRAFPANSTDEQPLVAYAEICVPQNQPPGEYRGQVVASDKRGRRAQVEIQLEVAVFSIPATSSLPNSFGLSLYSMAKGHRLSPETGEAKTLLTRYAVALLAHRVSAHGLSMQPPRRVGSRVDFSDYDREVGPLLEGRALPSGARFTTAEVRQIRTLTDASEAAAYYGAFRKHYADKGWRVQLFFYAKDEPKPEELEQVVFQAKPVQQAGGVPVLVTSPWDAKLAPAVGILCPTLNCFFPRAGPATCRNTLSTAELRKAVPAGTKIWWYQSCNSHGCTGGPAKDNQLNRAYAGWPSYMVDHPPALNRAMGTLAFREGIDGELYFDTVYAYNQKDPWRDLFEFGGNGDGTLFYPGLPSRLGGTDHFPVESLRLKHLRDGLEDYELLSLARSCGEAERASKVARTLTPSGYDIERSPEVWRRERLEISRRVAARWKAGECGRETGVSASVR